MVDITKILHGDRNHSIQNKLWPITSFIWCALITVFSKSKWIHIFPSKILSEEDVLYHISSKKNL